MLGKWHTILEHECGCNAWALQKLGVVIAFTFNLHSHN